MDPRVIDGLVNQSAAVILTSRGLYLFKVVVNDMKHDVEAMRKAMVDMQASLDRIAKLLERQGEGRNDGR